MDGEPSNFDPIDPSHTDLGWAETSVAGGPAGIGESPFEEIPADVLESPGQDADTAVEFRRTLGRFATGVTIITTRSGDKVHGMTANAFMSVSLRPPLVVVSVDRKARMHPLLHVGKTYGVSVLSRDQHELSDHFAGRPLEQVPIHQFDYVRDTPLIEGAIAHLVARVVQTYWGGDHSLFLGQVEYTRWGEGHPLLFVSGKYERLPPDPEDQPPGP